MDEFNYLGVLVSIVLGLGITQLLTGVGALIQQRAAVRVYWPSLAWAGILLLIHVQTWWSLYGLRDYGRWTFSTFLIVLLQPIVLYLLSVLVLPTAPPAEPFDLRDHYRAQAGWFFGLLGVLLLVSLAKDFALSGALPDGLNVAFHLVFLVLAGVGALTRSEAFHRANAALTAVLIGAYIATLFSRLA